MGNTQAKSAGLKISETRYIPNAVTSTLCLNDKSRATHA